MADQAKKGNKASADDKLKFLASIVKNSDISSVDWTLVAQDLGCIEGTLLKRWQGLRNEFLPGLTLKKMRAEDGVKPKAKTGGRGKGKAGKCYSGTFRAKCLTPPGSFSSNTAEQTQLTRDSSQLLKLKVKMAQG